MASVQGTTFSKAARFQEPRSEIRNTYLLNSEGENCTFCPRVNESNQKRKASRHLEGENVGAHLYNKALEARQKKRFTS